MAWSMWSDTGALKFNSPSSKNGIGKIIIKGFLINILNPKLSIFFLAFLPLFVSSESLSPMFEMFILSVVFMFMTLIIFILYGIAANGISRYVVDSPKVIFRLQRSFAAIFAALGVKLAMADQ